MVLAAVVDAWVAVVVKILEEVHFIKILTLASRTLHPVGSGSNRAGKARIAQPLRPRHAFSK